MRTFKYKLQDHQRNKHLHSDLEIIAHVYNHFVALCRRHYRIYGQCEGYKRLTFNRMSQHLTKLKRLDQITINSVAVHERAVVSTLSQYTLGLTIGELILLNRRVNSYTSLDALAHATIRPRICCKKL
jgi:hypothetical protein